MSAFRLLGEIPNLLGSRRESVAEPEQALFFGEIDSCEIPSLLDQCHAGVAAAGFVQMKSVLDVTACALLLLVLWPVFLIVAVAVRLESRGPAIFQQVRVGRNGREFTCYKFRTMVSGTGDLPTHEVSASAVTRLGNTLRRFKIDELPQVFNVLAGDMSLVGPRPCLPSQVELVEARRKLGVLDVRPGITGLAQVRGVDMSNPDRLAELDAQYVKSQSFVGDLGLLWATLRGQGVGVDQIVKT